jgi:hypothetical protein
MKIFLQSLIRFALWLTPFISFAQSNVNDIKSAQQMVNVAQQQFRDWLMTATIDPNIKKELQKFAINDVNHRQNNLQYFASAPREKRVKAIRSLSYFMKEIQQQLADGKIDQYKIPQILKSYKVILNDLLGKRFEYVEKDFRNLGWKSSQLLANAFWEFDDRKQISGLSIYKRVVETPQYIFSFLQSNPGFYYSDSLVMFMATNYPAQLVSYLQNQNSATATIRNNRNMVVQQLVNFSSNSMGSELAPFAEQVANNELVVEEILEKRKKITDYFQLIVDQVMLNQQKMLDGGAARLQTGLKNTLADKSLDFYVTKINELHNSTDAVRFQSVQNLRPQDLYYIIVSGDEEMYTSTYLGLYKRLMEYFKGGADSLFTMVNYDEFRKFMRIAATYNTLTDLLHRMPEDRSKELVHLFISNIGEEGEAISSASDIADAFISFSKDPFFNELVKNELSDGVKKSKKYNLYQSQRLYSILLRIYDLVNNDQPGNDITANYKNIPYSSLKDKQGNITTMLLFYGDEDGKTSFKSFMNIFKDKDQWKIESNDSWVAITSIQNNSIRLFANQPLSNDDGNDITVQEALQAYLEKNSIEPTILIHRGHSYHLPNTLKYLQPYTKLAMLGSCGGYKNMQKIMDINPDVHIIASKQTGTMTVNDPLLKQLYTYLQDGKNLDWVNFWGQLSESFKKDPAATKLFEEYIPPYKNLSSFVVRLYNYDSAPVDSL